MYKKLPKKTLNICYIPFVDASVAPVAVFSTVDSGVLVRFEFVVSLVSKLKLSKISTSIQHEQSNLVLPIFSYLFVISQKHVHARNQQQKELFLGLRLVLFIKYFSIPKISNP